MSLKSYIGRQLIALDQALNTLFGGREDETMSSRFGRGKAAGDWGSKVACDVLDVLEKDHCGKSVEFDAEGLPDAHHLDVVRRLTAEEKEAFDRAFRNSVSSTIGGTGVRGSKSSEVG